MKNFICRVMFGICLVWTAVACTSSFASATHSTPLPAEQAFKFLPTMGSNHQLTLQWHIAPGYYLYRQSIKVTQNGKVVSGVVYPKGKLKQDSVRGYYEAYADELSIPVPSTGVNSAQNLKVDFQGCSESGFCYPPMHKSFSIDSAKNEIAMNGVKLHSSESPVTFQTLLQNQLSIEKLLGAGGYGTLFIFAAIGILLALTPCVFPMAVILTGIILGQKHRVGTKKAFFLSLTYVLGMAVAYAFAGVMAALFGSSLQVWLQKPIFFVLGGLIFTLLALPLLGVFHFRSASRWQNWVTHWSNKQQGGTVIGVFCMGILSTLLVSPCVTAPLIGVLLYISQTGDVIFGASALFVMGMGIGVPLILVGMSAGKLLPKSGPWMEGVKKFFGILMLAIAVWLLLRLVPAAWATLAWSGFLLLSSAYFVFYLTPHAVGVRLHRVYQGMGVMALFLGLFLSYQSVGMMKEHYFTQFAQQTQGGFITVKNPVDLERQLALANASHKPVILDFYADWCESCVAMDRNVFSQPDIRQALSSFTLLRVDLTSNTLSDESVMKKFEVIAPPTILFFSDGGQEVASQRVIGELTAAEFLSRLNTFIAAGCNKNAYC